jgi:hypothetical protein
MPNPEMKGHTARPGVPRGGNWVAPNRLAAYFGTISMITHLL